MSIEKLQAALVMQDPFNEGKHIDNPAKSEYEGSDEFGERMLREAMAEHSAEHLALIAENARLREALTKISKVRSTSITGAHTNAYKMEQIALEALEGGGAT